MNFLTQFAHDLTVQFSGSLSSGHHHLMLGALIEFVLDADLSLRMRHCSARPKTANEIRNMAFTSPMPNKVPVVQQNFGYLPPNQSILYFSMALI